MRIIYPICLLCLATPTLGLAVESLNGSVSDDTIIGTERDDQIEGGGGDDSLQGGTGDDALRGGSGDDQLRGGTGDDSLEGGSGDDEIHGGAGDDELQGGDGDDALQGGSGDDILMGGSGFNMLFGGTGSDKFIIDIAADAPDEIMDFRPEDGDTVLLRFKPAPEGRLGEYEIKNVVLDARGEVTVQLINEDQFQVVRLRRSDLTLRVDDYGQDVRLIFTKKMKK
jgi:Ca2+-binding RTX toxin-like protein